MENEPLVEYNLNMQTRILFLGMQGAFSVPPLRALIQSDNKPVALAAPPPPGMQRPFSILNYPAIPGNPANIYQLAGENNIPIYEISRLNHPETLDWLHALRLDLVIVACFNRLLPKSWLSAPRLGCINLHPSLLPAFRGPTPLEDQLANGVSTTGITLHFMDEHADTGDIIAQQALPVGPDADLSSLERQAADVGADLLLRILENPENIPRKRQHN